MIDVVRRATWSGSSECISNLHAARQSVTNKHTRSLHTARCHKTVVCFVGCLDALKRFGVNYKYSLGIQRPFSKSCKSYEFSLGGRAGNAITGVKS